MVRELAWSHNGELIRVCDMSDSDLHHTYKILLTKVAVAKITQGKVSLSKLTLDYLSAELKDRGIDHEEP